MMKKLLFTTFLFCFYINFASAQNDYYKLKLKGGSKVFGQLLTENKQQYRILTNNSDTINISKRIIRKSYLIPGTFGKGEVVPIFQKGLFWGVQGGFGYGFQGKSDFPRPLNRNSFLYVAKIHGFLGYRLNNTVDFGLGSRVNHYWQMNSRSFLRQTYFFIEPYAFLKLNHRAENWGNIGLWFSSNFWYLYSYEISTIEFLSGISIFYPKRSFNIGLGFYNSFDFLDSNRYLSINFGTQF